MARKTAQNGNYGRVVGNLAYDFDREEQQPRRTAPRRAAAPPPRAAEKPAPRPAPKPVVRLRERERVSPVLVLGLVLLSVMTVALLTGYASLAAVSSDVVAAQKELSALRDENVALLTDYERTFDIDTVKAAAEAAGMSKPSASQIYRVDLSEPDSVVIYQSEDASLLARVFTSLGQSVGSVVEYFR